MRARPLLALAAIPSLFLSAKPAHADDAPARPLVRLLRSSTRPHPLADRSGRIPISVALPSGVDARSFGVLPVAPGVGAIRLAPEEVDAFAEAHPELSLYVSPPLRPLLDVSQKWTRLPVFRDATGGAAGKGVVVGIVDTGLDVAHPDFRNADGTTRVAWMLQGGRKAAGLHPELEAAFGCKVDAVTCAVFSAADIDAMLSGASAMNPPRDLGGHGTHVASIAAGNGGPLAGTPVYVGVAPEATLVVASPASDDGFQDTDILNATRFVFERGDEMGLPTVVNLSVGGDFGPHDGTSLIEKGLAALIGNDKPGHSIVTAAGNSGALYKMGDRGPFGVHTEVRITEHSEVRVPIATPASKSGNGYVWITFRPGDEVCVGVDGPGGESWIGLVEPGDEAGYDEDETSAAVVNRLPNGKTPITADTNSAVVVFEGKWDEGAVTLRLQGHGDAQLWVTGLGDVSSSKSAGLLFERAVRQGTIAVPASHPSLISVGCTLNRVSWDPLTTDPLTLASVGGELDPLADSLCYFSAAGPTPFGVPKPEISAPGGFVAAAMSRDADPRNAPGGLFDGAGCPQGEPCYVVDDRHAITAGTSMSAPHVTGTIALLFELDRTMNGKSTLTQARLTELLQAGARWPTGTVRHETQLGVGALDIEGARRAFMADPGASDPPSVEKSWWVLSSAYARPDRTWPVHGTVELRRADGEIANGVDASELELSVTGGVVVQPITKVRNGLFRFAVAGEEGRAGQTMTVDVRFAGRTIEVPREIPIGEDAWRSNGVVDATSGGCAWPEAEKTSQRQSPFGVTIGVALAGVASWRRRSRKEAARSGSAGRRDRDRP